MDNSGNKPTKPFLRKGAGVNGKLMNKIYYPVLKTPPRTIAGASSEYFSNEEQPPMPPPLASELDFGLQNIRDGTISDERATGGAERAHEGVMRSSSSSSQITSQEHRPGSSRPVTRTTDSGCPKDPLYLLSPVISDHAPSVVKDITTDGDLNSNDSREPVCSPLTYESDHGPSVVFDVTEYPESGNSGVDTVVRRAKLSNDARNSEGIPVVRAQRSSTSAGQGPSVIVDVTNRDAVTSPETESVTSSSEAKRGQEHRAHGANISVGDSTVEFENLESKIHAFLSPVGESVTSHTTDGSRSKHWRSVVREFRDEAGRKNQFGTQSTTPASTVSSSTLPSSNSVQDPVTPSPMAREFNANDILEETRMRIHQMNSDRRRRSSASSVTSSVGLRPMRSVFPSIFDKHGKRRDREIGIRPSRSTLRQPQSTTTTSTQSPESSGVGLTGNHGSLLAGRGKSTQGRGISRPQPRLRLRHSHSTPLLGESFGEESPGGRMARELIARDFQTRPEGIKIPSLDIGGTLPSENYANTEARHLAKQLRDLIAHLDVVGEEHRRRVNEFEEVYDILIDENEELGRKVKDLSTNVQRLEEADRLRNETLEMLRDSERNRSEDLQRLKRENDLWSKKQRMKQNDESAVLKVCREQIEELKKSKRELERQRIDQRSQMRKLETTIKQKDKRIEEIADEKDRLERRFKLFANQRAKQRGRQAEETMLNEAMEDASNKPPRSMVTKRIGGMTLVRNGDKRAETQRNGKENMMPTLGTKLGPLPEGMTDTTDSGEGTMLMDSSASNSPIPGFNGKSVRWNEPLATTFRLPYANSSLGSADGTDANSDMYVTRMEKNLLGNASLYESNKGDFSVYTKTHCGCNYYEYSNTDVRWLHPSNKYQVNYYGHIGATTVQIEGGALLIRHFMDGQLEIYRRSGEITLVVPNGKRTEVIRDHNGIYRTEIYESSGQVRVLSNDGCESLKNTTSTSCYRTDGSYVSYVDSDQSYEWRAVDYIVRRFQSGDVKVRLTLIDTSITLLCCDVGTVKHLNKPTNCTHKYCVEWGTVARNRSRQAASSR